MLPVLRDPRAHARGSGVACAPSPWRTEAGCVDKPGAWASRTASRLSREVGDVLDAADLIEEAYDLEVSSPGLDRQLPEGARVPLGGRQAGAVLAGRAARNSVADLADVDDARLTLDRDGERVELPARACHQGPSRGRRCRGRDGRSNHEPRIDHRDRAARPGEGDRQRDPLRSGGVCPAIGLAKVARPAPTTSASRSTARPASSASTMRKKVVEQVADPELEISLRRGARP